MDRQPGPSGIGAQSRPGYGPWHRAWRTVQTLAFNAAGKVHSSLLTTSTGVHVMADGTSGPPHLRRTSESSSARCDLGIAALRPGVLSRSTSINICTPLGPPTLLNLSSRDDDTLRDQARARRDRSLDAQTLQRRPPPAARQARGPSHRRMPAALLEAGLAASQP